MVSYTICSIYEKNSFIDVRLGFKYVSENDTVSWYNVTKEYHKLLVISLKTKRLFFSSAMIWNYITVICPRSTN